MQRTRSRKPNRACLQTDPSPSPVPELAPHLAIVLLVGIVVADQLADVIVAVVAILLLALGLFDLFLLLGRGGDRSRALLAGDRCTRAARLQDGLWVELHPARRADDRTAIEIVVLGCTGLANPLQAPLRLGQGTSLLLCCCAAGPQDHSAIG